MTEALAWGAVGASSLVLGALLGLAREWSSRTIGIVLAFGAGALISAVSFDLAQEGVAIGGAGAVALGLGAGALTYYLANMAVERMGKRSGNGSGAGSALALGAVLDGIPEQAVLGIVIAVDGEVGAGLLAAVFISNLPEAVGSVSEMRGAGRSRSSIMRLWIAVAVVCTLACVGGYAIADVASGELQAAINGFAAGALLVMLIDSMIPDASRRAGNVGGLVAVLGFAVAAGLSGLG